MRYSVQSSDWSSETFQKVSSERSRTQENFDFTALEHDSRTWTRVKLRLLSIAQRVSLSAGTPRLIRGSPHVATSRAWCHVGRTRPTGHFAGNDVRLACQCAKEVIGSWPILHKEYFDIDCCVSILGLLCSGFMCLIFNHFSRHCIKFVCY